MYPSFIKKAQEEGNNKAVQVFTRAKLAEAYHAKLYMDAYTTIDTPFDGKYYLCPICGYITPHFSVGSARGFVSRALFAFSHAIGAISHLRACPPPANLAPPAAREPLACLVPMRPRLPLAGFATVRGLREQVFHVKHLS